MENDNKRFQNCSVFILLVRLVTSHKINIRSKEFKPYGVCTVLLPPKFCL